MLRQTTLPLFLCVFTVFPWPGEKLPTGIPFSDWSDARANAPYQLASLPIDPAPAELSGLQMSLTYPDEAFDNAPANPADSGAATVPLPPPAPDVAIEDVCVAMAAAAQRSDLPVGFFARLIWQESKFAQHVVSRAGAQGVAQFMPDTAAWIGLPNPFDPISALPASARFLRMLHAQFGNLGLAAAAYNAGPGRIQNWLAGRGSLPDETRNYVRIITGHEPEKWLAPREIEVSFHLPARAPCEGLAGLSRTASAEKVDVTVEPAILKLIETARAEAAAKAARAAQAKRLAKKGSARAKALARNKAGKTEASKKAPDAPLKLATN